VLASIYCRKSLFDDVLILNTKGRIIETVASNLFIMKNGEILTPARGEGQVNGIMRSIIISLCNEYKLTAKEILFTEDEVLNADEIFLTNVIQGIRWVERYKDKMYENKIASYLLQLLNEHVRKEIG
jgi:branched-chain amino acid aminotransferase